MRHPQILALVFSTAVAAAAADAVPVRITVPYSAPGKGFLSLALYDSAGGLVRSLLSAEPVLPGAGTVTWDATTDLGVPVGAGAYTPKGVFFTEPPALSWVMKVGKSGDPPWRTTDGRGDWGGNLGGPAGLCSNAGSVVMVWGCVEDNQITGIQQMDADGKISLRYHSFYPWDQRSAAAMDARNLYIAILKDCQELQIAEYTLGEPRGRILAKLPAKMKNRASGRWRDGGINVVDGIALTADRIFASVGSNDELYVINRADGAIVKTLQVANARGLAIRGDRLLVASGEEVQRYTLDGAPDGVAVSKGVLRAAHTVCVGVDGSLWVGDSGSFDPNPEHDLVNESGSRRIYGFDPAGKLIHTIGKAGGAKRSGSFDAAAIGDIHGMCLTPRGNALMVNDTVTGFARTSRWSFDGKLEQQWFARGNENWPDAVNPALPEETVKVGGPFSDDFRVQAWHMDFERKTWQPAWGHTMPYAANWQDAVIEGFGHGGNPLKKEAGHPGTWATFGWGAEGGLRTYKGRNYMLSSEGTLYTYAADQAPKLVAQAFVHRCTPEATRIIQNYDQGPNSWYAWADRNGDGMVQIGEATVTTGNQLLEPVKRMLTCALQANLDILFTGLTAIDPVSGTCSRPYRLPLAAILDNGVPVYDWSKVEEVTPGLKLPSFDGGAGGKKVTNVWIGQQPMVDGTSSYLIAEPSSDVPLKLPGIDGDGWWAGRNWRKKICRFDTTTGQCLWAVGRRAPGVAERGQMYNPITLAGVADGAVFAADAMAVVWVWDVNGLYLGRLYNGPDDRKADEYSMYVEMQGATVISHLGRTWLMANDCGTSVHEVHLPKRQAVAGSPVTVTQELAKRAVGWDPDGLTPGKKPVHEVHYLPSHKQGMAMKIDGDFDGREGWYGWDGVKTDEMLVLLDGERLATVRTLYDDENLYLAYQVRAPNGPLNAGTELPICPFVSGAYLDASFAPTWSQPQRADVLEGDVRVLFAQVKGADGKPQPFQHGYWQMRKGGRGGQTITSPAATLRMDQIAEIPGIQLAWRVGSTDQQTGKIDYQVEVSIPLAEIGLTGVKGKRIGFDTSIGVANPAGDRRERAGHWGGLSEAAVVDRPGSHRLLPENWGTLVFLDK